MTELENNKYHYLFALLLGVAGLLIILIFVTIRSQADESTSTVAISNTAPVIENIAVTTTASYTANNGSGGINWTDGTDNTVYVNIAYHDDNGCGDVINEYGATAGVVTTTFYHQGPNGVSLTAADNSNNHYTTVTCTEDSNSCSSSTDLSGTVQCTVPNFRYWADTTGSGTPNANDNWTAYVVLDDGGSSNNTVSATATVPNNVGAALGFTTSTDNSSIASLNFGTLALGANTGGANTGTRQLGIKNTGNIQVDLEVYGTAMACASHGQSSGSIATTNTKYGFALGAATSSWANLTYTLQTGASTSLDFNLPKRTHASDDTDSIHNTTTYWAITIPSTGVAGTCTSTNTIGAIAQTY